MFLFKKNNAPSIKEYSDTITNAKNIVFYNENGQEEYTNIASNQILINKTLNYLGKKLQSATIEITTNSTGYTSIETKTVKDTVYTLGTENNNDFYFVELGIENADVTISISKTQNDELVSIRIQATGNIADGITMLSNN